MSHSFFPFTVLAMSDCNKINFPSNEESVGSKTQFTKKSFHLLKKVIKKFKPFCPILDSFASCHLSKVSTIAKKIIKSFWKNSLKKISFSINNNNKIHKATLADLVTITFVWRFQKKICDSKCTAWFSSVDACGAFRVQNSWWLRGSFSFFKLNFFFKFNPFYLSTFIHHQTRKMREFFRPARNCPSHPHWEKNPKKFSRFFYFRLLVPSPHAMYQPTYFLCNFFLLVFAYKHEKELKAENASR